METAKHIRTGELEMLLAFFKALADETRLKMIGLLTNQEFNVGQLADLLDLTEPTVSHHLAKLRELGLVNLRTDGNNRYYRLNLPMLNQMKKYVQDMEKLDFKQPENDTSWLAALNFDDWERKVLSDYTFNGRITQFPTKDKKFLVILRWMASQFQPGVRYSEPEVNDILRRYHDDYAQLRRELVEYQFMERENGGGKYWLKE